MRIGIVVLLIILAGCETSSPVMPAGKDTYLVSSHVAACVSCSAQIQSLKTANAFCAKRGLFAVIRTANGVTNAFGYNVSNELLFSCVTADDPDYRRATLRPDNGVTTIEQK